MNHQAQSVLVKNADNFEEQISVLSDKTQTQTLGADSDGSGNLLLDSAAGFSGNITFASRYPGTLGNSLAVSICGRSTDFDAWDYASVFDGAPATSTYVENNPGSAQLDECHIVVADKLGQITGTRGAVLETYPFLSKVKGATTADGVNNYALDVINKKSSYVHMLGWDSDHRTSGAGNVLSDTDNSNFSNNITGIIDHTFSNGVNSGSLGASEYATGHALFADKDQVEVDFLIAPGLSGASWGTVVNDLVSIAEGRKDCMVTSSPPRTAVVNVSNTANIITDTLGSVGNLSKRSSYHVMDNNYLKVYDKFNDQYIHIPAASSTAGLMAKTDIERAPWFSPAGARRGGYLGITSISYSPTKGQRDSLYKNGVNPIANIPGQGTLLFGDKTALSRTSAF